MYIIRYSLVPEEPKQKRLDLLRQFCREAKLDEVMFMIMPEEYNRGPWRKNDYQPWLDFAAEARQLVEKEGYKTSLNLWHTLLHTDRGRRSEDVKFRRMVNDDGYQNLSVGCPLCPDWQKIWLDTFADWAQAGFKKIWIEDDFRFHNHSGHGWGGCFCEEHMRILRERGIKAKTREELFANMNARGIVHSDRKIWQQLNAETYIELAKMMRSRMDSIDPKIKLGLMTSYIPVHTIEGRDWTGLIDALGGPERAMVRPHACGYQEICGSWFFWSFGNLAETLGVLPKGTKTFFEIENSPMSRFAKSNYQTKMQMACVIDGGCDGLTFDTLDFLGTGPASEPEMAPMLREAKAKMLKIRDLTAGSTPIGVQAVLPANTTAVAPGKGIAGISNLPTTHYGWFVYLSGFGIPCVNRPVIPQIDAEQLYALAGDAVWAIPDASLRNMLESAAVLLDADAARIVLERGLGDLIGLKKVTRYDREQSMFSFEEHVDRDPNEIPERAGLNRPLRDFFICLYDLTEISKPRTMVKDCFLRDMGAGSVIYRNATGGRGLILPFAVPAENLIPHGWTRKKWIDRWLRELCGAVTLPQLINGAWMHISVHDKGHKTIFLANQMFEFYKDIQIRLPKEYVHLNWRMEIHSRDMAGKIKLNGDLLTVETELAGNDWLMLVGE